MIDLQRFFENHFDSGRISDNKLRRFSEAHLRLLATNDPEEKYTQILEEATLAHTAYYGSQVDEDVKFAVQQGYTKRKNSLFDRFKSLVSQKEGIIRGTFGKDTPEYEEFFPLGISEYRQATLSTIDTLMERIVAAAKKYEGRLGKDLYHLFVDIRDEYASIRQTQLEKIGEVSESKADSEATRDVLETCLMRNVLLIAVDNIGHPEWVSQFFDQSVL